MTRKCYLLFQVNWRGFHRRFWHLLGLTVRILEFRPIQIHGFRNNDKSVAVVDMYFVVVDYN